MNHGRLEVELHFSNGQTWLGRQGHCAPLKLARPFPLQCPCGPGLELCIMDSSPGMLAGDSSTLTWNLKENALALVTTQGHTRVHPGAGARQQVSLSVATGARLFYLPECTLLFAGAHLETEVEAHVAPGGSLVFLETVAAGRLAHGERFQFQQYRGSTHLRHGLNWALCAQNHFEPARLAPTAPGSWQGFSHWSNLYLVDGACTVEWYRASCRLVESWNGIVCAACSTLPHGGMAVSFLGHGAHDLRTAALQMVDLWQQLMAN